ncbi:recombinase family protein [Lentzea tibetensis]|uniref:Recombinase family protein n=1 Tax=Lentzea tibetensis TaxID=2591470 RepID=A0A563EH88_9PSEU|nr:recombinase family protein [Lentzea tibetensis]TWP45980.1 recombinase family protein [Lentzea tibetensis]
MQAQLNSIERAHRGDLSGLNLAGLVRLSFETDTDYENAHAPRSGADINNRDEQVKLCRQHVTSRGGSYVYTYDEPDTSAWKKKRVKQPDGTYKYRVIRPVFEGALSDLKRGIAPNGSKLDGIIVYDIDRLTRDQRNMEDAIEVVEFFQRPIIDITGSLDLLTENGRDMARVLVTMAGKQSVATSRRLRASHRARAHAGIPTGGGNRPFGWWADRRTLFAEEVVHINKAIEDLFNGLPAYTICKRWTEAGVLTPMGNPWKRRNFVLMMTNPRMVGRRVYGPTTKPLHERYAVDEFGKPVKAQHEPIMDEKTYNKVVAVLVGPGRPEGHAYTGKKRYLCSGKIRCGNCGRKCLGGAQPNGRHVYACKPPSVDGGCGQVCGAGIAIDDLVTKLILAYLANRTVTQAVKPWPRSQELEDAHRKRTDLLEQFKQNTDMGTYIWPQIRELEKEITALTKEQSLFNRQQTGPKVTNVADSWEHLDTDERRAIVDELVEVIVLDPASRPSNRFEPTRLKVVFRQEAPQSGSTALRSA